MTSAIFDGKPVTISRRTLCLCLAALVFWPMSASANAGTPLMWATEFHLLFGNALIGAAEGFLIARFFRASATSTTLAMVLANYFSAWVGFLVLGAISTRVLPELLGDQPLYRAAGVLGLVLGASFLVSVLCELPFCWFCLRKAERPWQRAAFASTVVQTASYAVIIPCYLAVGHTSLLFGVEHEASLAFARNTRAWVYFIEPEKGDIARIRPDGTQRQFVMKAGVTNQFARLELLPTRPGEKWDLALVMGRGNPAEAHVTKVLIKMLAKRAVAEESDFIEDTHLNFGNPVDYRTTAEARWRISLRYWAAGGVRAENPATGERRQFALEVPFIMDWQARNATVLPGELLIYQLGQQIVALDIERRKIGLVAMGRGPVVVLEE